ncbi:MAG: glycosyl hydrolase family 5 [Pelagibacterium sp. SCN 64-44]|nr:MAG: glycosyl hydrolase family 5 [Pelagibacterium sp. SCN 64-44]
MILRLLALLLPLAAAGLALPVSAQPVANPVATFAGLDKITGRITRFDVYIGETVLFGALEITPRACYNRPSTETQRTSAFLEVDQRSLTGVSRRIFTGWMFADSPALHAVDHAIYDVWLIACKTSTDVPPPDQR